MTARGVWVGIRVKKDRLFYPLYLPIHTGPSYKPYCMPSLTVALLLLEWLHDGVYAGRCLIARVLTPITKPTFGIEEEVSVSGRARLIDCVTGKYR